MYLHSGFEKSVLNYAELLLLLHANPSADAKSKQTLQETDANADTNYFQTNSATSADSNINTADTNTRDEVVHSNPVAPQLATNTSIRNSSTTSNNNSNTIDLTNNAQNGKKVLDRLTNMSACLTAPLTTELLSHLELRIRELVRIRESMLKSTHRPTTAPNDATNTNTNPSADTSAKDGNNFETKSSTSTTTINNFISTSNPILTAIDSNIELSMFHQSSVLVANLTLNFELPELACVEPTYLVTALFSMLLSPSKSDAKPNCSDADGLEADNSTTTTTQNKRKHNDAGAVATTARSATTLLVDCLPVSNQTQVVNMLSRMLQLSSKECQTATKSIANVRKAATTVLNSSADIGASASINKFSSDSESERTEIRPKHKENTSTRASTDKFNPLVLDATKRTIDVSFTHALLQLSRNSHFVSSLRDWCEYRIYFNSTSIIPNTKNGKAHNNSNINRIVQLNQKVRLLLTRLESLEIALLQTLQEIDRPFKKRVTTYTYSSSNVPLLTNRRVYLKIC